MSEKIRVRATFLQTVPFTGEIDMDRAEYLQLSEKLDAARGREYRQLQEELFGRFMFSASDGDFGANDPELDDFSEVPAKRS